MTGRATQTESQTVQRAGADSGARRRKHRLRRLLEPDTIAEHGRRRSTSSLSFTATHSKQPDQGHGPGHKKLECVPHKQQREHVQPARAAGFDQPGAEDRSERVWDSEQHQRNAPLETAPGVDRVKHDVGRHEPPHGEVGAGGDGPDESEHASAFQVFGNENLEGLPVGRESCHRNKRWRVIEIAYEKV